jgi:hypothetical protein
MPPPLGFEITHTDENETGLRLYKITDPVSGQIVTFAELNKDLDVAPLIAWAGSRISRFGGTFEEIFRQIKGMADKDGSFAGDKLANFFSQYGHSSVAGMAPVFLYINKIPIHLAFWIFNHLSVGDGQEMSTRYVKLEDLGITPIENLIDLSDLGPTDRDWIQKEWTAIQELAVTNYEEWEPLIREAYVEQFGTDLSPNTLKARILDFIRNFIPAGAATSMAMLLSARMWVDLVKQMREYDDPVAQKTAEQILVAMNLQDYEEAEGIKSNLSGLTEHSNATMTVTKNLEALREHLLLDESFKQLVIPRPIYEPIGNRIRKIRMDHPESLGLGIAMQSIIALYPYLDEVEVLEWLSGLQHEQKAYIGEIIMSGHNHHDLLRNMGDIRGSVFFVLETTLGCLRDLNRHRAYGRFTPMNETDDIESILNMGHIRPFQLLQTDKLKQYIPKYDETMQNYYQKIQELVNFIKQKLPSESQKYIMRLLPLGHRAVAHFSSSLPQLSYMIHQRYAEGGDLNYRDVVSMMMDLIREDAFLSRMATHITHPDANSKQEFVSRK